MNETEKSKEFILFVRSYHIQELYCHIRNYMNNCFRNMTNKYSNLIFFQIFYNDNMLKGMLDCVEKITFFTFSNQNEK